MVRHGVGDVGAQRPPEAQPPPGLGASPLDIARRFMLLEMRFLLVGRALPLPQQETFWQPKDSPEGLPGPLLERRDSPELPLERRDLLPQAEGVRYLLDSSRRNRCIR